MGNMTPASSPNERTKRGYVPYGTTKQGAREYIEHDCNPPDTAREWTCGCGRKWRPKFLGIF